MAGTNITKAIFGAQHLDPQAWLQGNPKFPVRTSKEDGVFVVVWRITNHKQRLRINCISTQIKRYSKPVQVQETNTRTEVHDVSSCSLQVSTACLPPIQMPTAKHIQETTSIHLLCCIQRRFVDPEHLLYLIEQPLDCPALFFH